MDEPQTSKLTKRSYLSCPKFPGRGGANWVGPLIDYKELDLLRRCMTTSSKIMSRKRTGTNTQEQRALQAAIKRARFLALIPYSGI